MPYVFENTRIWNETLAPQEDRDHAIQARERLRTVFLRFRDKVALLAAEIHRDLPDYTVHDITHLDALWEMADIIVGDQYELTPTEAFVLGGAFLLHDLGMGLASYPDRLDGLRKEENWADIVTAQFQYKYDRLPTNDEIIEPPDSIKKDATALMLRNLHAKHAEHLAQISWKATIEDPPQFLIDDNEIRQTYARLIGLISHSHWWPISRVEKEFSRTVGSPHWCPNTWIVDPLKVACVLRVSDASHIDARRAPSFLRAIRKPSNYSDEHWKFQEKLQKPYRVDDALAYTSGYAFPLKDAQSWWLCLDTLTMIDKELRQVDALLADKGLPRLAARRVAGIESPERLVSFIPAEEWLPINAFLQVSDVPRLVKSLGGEELYGVNPTVPLREMIQNSADAIRARRIVERREKSWGEIVVRLGRDERGDWLEVEDNGIGMSSEVLTKHLLDFGVTYWGSNLMMEEFPGLLAAGLKTTGKYGIGFFSIFMLGEAVRIRTRRCDAAQDQTLIFEFNTGLSARPIIRPASTSERIRDGGTCTRIWLDKPPRDTRGLLSGSENSLADVCRILCPSLDVNITSEDNGVNCRVICADDWTDLDAEDFLSRLPKSDPSKDYEGIDYRDFTGRVAKNLRPLRNDNGDIVGRACIVQNYDRWRRGVVTVGGLASCRLSGILGILSGVSVRATRDIALPLVTKESLSAWASEQARLIPALYQQEKDQSNSAVTVRTCGGETGPLPIARYRNRWVTFENISSCRDLPDELILISDFEIRNVEDLKGFKLASNVMVTDSGGSTILQPNSFASFSSGYYLWPESLEVYFSEDDYYRKSFMRGIEGAVAEAAAKAWAVDINEMLSQSSIRNYETRLIGSVEGEELYRQVRVLKNPK